MFAGWDYENFHFLPNQCLYNLNFTEYITSVTKKDKDFKQVLMRETRCSERISMRHSSRTRDSILTGPRHTLAPDFRATVNGSPTSRE